METRKPSSVGAVVTPSLVQPVSNGDNLELPQWLSVPDPKPVATSKAMRELVHSQYDSIFERVIEQIYRGRSLASLLRSEEHTSELQSH